MLPARIVAGEEYPWNPADELESIWKVTTVEEARDLSSLLYGLPLDTITGVDTETDGVDPTKESPVGKGIVVTMQLSWLEGIEGLSLEEIVDGIINKSLVPTRVWVDCRELAVLWALKPWLESDRSKALHNTDFDYHVLRNTGVHTKGVTHDTLLMSRLEYPERQSHGLDGNGGFVDTVLNERRLTTKQALGTNKIGKRGGLIKQMELLPMSVLVDDEGMQPYQVTYSTFDTFDCVRAAYIMEHRLRMMDWNSHNGGLYGYWKMEGVPYLPVLMGMERTGVCIDKPIVEMLLEEYEILEKELDGKVWEWAGVPVNLGSSKQKSWLLYGDGELELNDTATKRKVKIMGRALPCEEWDQYNEYVNNGSYGRRVDHPWEGKSYPSTDKEHLNYTMDRLAEQGLQESEEYKVLQLFKDRSEVSTLVKSTLRPLLRNLRAQHVTGERPPGTDVYVHGLFNLWKARTGRLSAVQPNLQNIPSTTYRGKRIRHAFVAATGERMIVADYSQLELRILAYFVKAIFDDSALADAIEEGDLHQAVADALGISRKAAKAVNFGLIYGITAFKLSRDLGMTVDEAQAMLDAYFVRYPGVAAYMEWAKEIAHKTGTARTIAGRYRQLPNINEVYRRGRRAGEYTWRARKDERRAMNCVDGETEALTRRGWVKGFDLRKDDVLLTKNPCTGCLEWQGMIDLKQWPDYNGPLVEFKSKSFSAVSTPNHRWLVDSKQGAKSMEVTTETMSRHGDHRIHRTGTFPGAPHAVFSDDFVELCGWFLTDGSLRIREDRAPQVVITQQKKNNCSYLDLLGGRMGFQRRPASLSYDLSNVGPDVVDAGTVFSLEWGGKRQESTGTELFWSVKGTLRDALLNQLPDRVLTVEFMSKLTGRQLRRLLNTMMLGDGTKEEANGRVTKAVFCAGTDSKKDMFQLLATLCGYATTATFRKVETVREGQGVVRGSCWYITLLKRKRAQVTSAQRQEFTESRGVWCPIVPNTFFVARRENTVYITGNTPIQGSAQDIVQRAMLIIARDEQLRAWGYVLRIQVHDELVGTCPEENAEKCLARVILLMESSYKPDAMKGVRFRVEGFSGHNWGEAKEGKMFLCPHCKGKGQRANGDKCKTCDKDGELTVAEMEKIAA